MFLKFMHVDGSATVYDDIDHIRFSQISLVLNAENDVSYPGKIECGDEDYMEYVYLIEDEPHYAIGSDWSENQVKNARKKAWGDKELFYNVAIGERKGKHFEAVFNNVCYLCNDNGKTMQKIGYPPPPQCNAEKSTATL